jgi:hypothetical protein
VKQTGAGADSCCSICNSCMVGAGEAQTLRASSVCHGLQAIGSHRRCVH